MADKQADVVGVRFSSGGKIYHFDAAGFQEITEGDFVVVETSRGIQLGEVTQLIQDAKTIKKGRLRSIMRLATPADLLLRQTRKCQEKAAVHHRQTRLRESGMHTAKVVTTEFSHDGERVTVLVSSEGEQKLDLKAIRQKISSLFRDETIEIRQIGPRDVAKVIGGLGACGIENRCCSRFLTDFCSISIRMAKEQGISLTPTEITGICGRLRCCLNYEYEHYAEMRKGLPKKNKRVNTPLGIGKVVEVLTLKETVLVDIPETGIKEFSKEEISAADPTQFPQEKKDKPHQAGRPPRTKKSLTND